MKLSKAQIQEAQRVLKGLGMYKGALDGIYGSGTRTAVRAFQRYSKLDDDGILGPRTWEALFPTRPKGTTTTTVVPPQAPGSGTVLMPSVVTALVRNRWPRQKDVPAFYGPVGKNQVKVPIPFKLWIAWDLRKSVQSMTVHQKVASSVARCYQAALDHYGAQKIADLDLDVWGGSLNVRKMRGGTSYSMHSWGIAIDTDPANNQLKWNHTKAKFARAEYKPWFEIWEAEGWLSLGRARDYDWMHVQAAQL
ncbi:MAG: peptidoglycan-binding protein [Nitrospira sp.]